MNFSLKIASKCFGSEWVIKGHWQLIKILQEIQDKKKRYI